jgi:hypothetical protein
MRGDRLDLTRCDNIALALNGTSVKLDSVGVWDLSKLLPPDAPPLAGSLALDAFSGHVVTLNLAAGTLTIESSQSLQARLKGAREIPVRFSREVQGLALTPMIAVDTPKGRLWMELDSGSDAPLIVGKHAAQALGLDAAKTGAQDASLKLAGGPELSAKASLQDLILDGNIGAPVLKDWIITIDLDKQRLWIAPVSSIKQASK